MTELLERITLTAPDISCDHCVRAIREEVSALEGVASVEPSVSTKQVDIAFDPARVSVGEIEAAMDEAGYPVQH
jgi:copper chaperone